MSAEEAKRLNILPPDGNISNKSSLNRTQANRSNAAPPVAVVQGKQVPVQNLSHQSRWVTIQLYLQFHCTSDPLWCYTCKGRKPSKKSKFVPLPNALTTFLQNDRQRNWFRWWFDLQLIFFYTGCKTVGISLSFRIIISILSFNDLHWKTGKVFMAFVTSIFFWYEVV